MRKMTDAELRMAWERAGEAASGGLQRAALIVEELERRGTRVNLKKLLPAKQHALVEQMLRLVEKHKLIAPGAPLSARLREASYQLYKLKVEGAESFPRK